MIKRLKKGLVAVLSAVMLVGALWGCGTGGREEAKGADTGGGAAETTAPAEKLFIGYMGSQAQDETSKEFNRNREVVVKAAGINQFGVDADYSTDGMILNVEKLIAAKVNGFAFIPVDEAVLPVVSQKAKESKTYFYLSMRNVDDPEIRKLLEDNPYYIGCQYEDEAKAGYNLIKGLSQEKGAKKIALIARPLGDKVATTRDEGIQKAAKEFGVEIVAESRTISQASDATKAVESFVSAYPDLDAIVHAGSVVAGTVPAIIKGLEDQGKAGKVLVAGWDWVPELSEYFDKGYIYAFAGGHFGIENNVANAIVANYIKGTPLSDKKLELKIPLILATKSEDIENYIKYAYGDGVIYNEQELKKGFFKFENSDVTAESIQEILDKWSLEDLVNRRSK